MTSPELPGFIQIGEDLQVLTSQTPQLMAQLLELDYGAHVEVVEIEQPKKQRTPIANMVKRPQVTHWWGAPPLPC